MNEDNVRTDIADDDWVEFSRWREAYQMTYGSYPTAVDAWIFAKEKGRQQGRESMRDEAVKLCTTLPAYNNHEEYKFGCEDCADAIKELK